MIPLLALLTVLVSGGQTVVLHEFDPAATFPECERVGKVRSGLGFSATSWEEARETMASQAVELGANFVHVRSRDLRLSLYGPPRYRMTGRAYRCPDDVWIGMIVEAQR